jgi:hypothetical protein
MKCTEISANTHTQCFIHNCNFLDNKLISSDATSHYLLRKGMIRIMGLLTGQLTSRACLNFTVNV